MSWAKLCASGSRTLRLRAWGDPPGSRGSGGLKWDWGLCEAEKDHWPLFPAFPEAREAALPPRRAGSACFFGIALWTGCKRKSSLLQGVCKPRPGDLSGHLLAYLSLSPVFVIVGFVTLIIFKRELHTISFLGGLALNEGVNWLIKHVIQEPRPCGGPHTAVGTKYGMPSSHSQFMWFFSVYSFLFLYLRMHQTNNARFLDLLWRHVLSLGLLTAAFLVSYSRPVSEFFLIRDTSLIPNVLWFEYTVTRAEARNRQRKLGTKLQ
ncbi:dolichyldiphosphatase 1 isoform X2 [Marmota marmota marmota]|uniref:dolichyldiphosphatase 1 isoform X2 n=1 Tax=Marmota marmota marmota TaxID=9994 RepID=UPI002093C55B|nr:dolichyldiphosphatase 1 isoform X2 [Marmota marmota marmota]